VNPSGRALGEHPASGESRGKRSAFALKEREGSESAPRVLLRDSTRRLIQDGIQTRDGRRNVARMVEELDGVAGCDGVFEIKDHDLGGE
jgi:uncharacterized protein (DUF3084 family)